MTIHMKESTPSDAQELSALVLRTFHDSFASQFAEEGLTTFEQIFRPEEIIARAKNTPAYNCTVARIGRQAAGMMEIGNIGPGIRIISLFVDPGFQRRGIGRALFEKVIGADTRQIVTVLAAPGAPEAYRKLGFTEAADWATFRGMQSLPMIRHPQRDVPST